MLPFGFRLHHICWGPLSIEEPTGLHIHISAWESLLHRSAWLTVLCSKCQMKSAESERTGAGWFVLRSHSLAVLLSLADLLVYFPRDKSLWLWFQAFGICTEYFQRNVCPFAVCEPFWGFFHCCELGQQTWIISICLQSAFMHAWEY